MCVQLGAMVYVFSCFRSVLAPNRVLLTIDYDLYLDFKTDFEVDCFRHEKWCLCSHNVCLEDLMFYI